MTVCHFSDDETEKHFVGGAVGSPSSSVLVVSLEKMCFACLEAGGFCRCPVSGQR